MPLEYYEILKNEKPAPLLLDTYLLSNQDPLPFEFLIA